VGRKEQQALAKAKRAAAAQRKIDESESESVSVSESVPKSTQETGPGTLAGTASSAKVAEPVLDAQPAAAAEAAAETLSAAAAAALAAGAPVTVQPSSSTQSQGVIHNMVWATDSGTQALNGDEWTRLGIQDEGEGVEQLLIQVANLKENMRERLALGIEGGDDTEFKRKAVAEAKRQVVIQEHAKEAIKKASADGRAATAEDLATEIKAAEDLAKHDGTWRKHQGSIGTFSGEYASHHQPAGVIPARRRAPAPQSGPEPQPHIHYVSGQAFIISRESAKILIGGDEEAAFFAHLLKKSEKEEHLCKMFTKGVKVYGTDDILDDTISGPEREWYQRRDMRLLINEKKTPFPQVGPLKTDTDGDKVQKAYDKAKFIIRKTGKDVEPGTVAARDEPQRSSRDLGTFEPKRKSQALTKAARAAPAPGSVQARLAALHGDSDGSQAPAQKKLLWEPDPEHKVTVPAGLVDMIKNKADEQEPLPPHAGQDLSEADDVLSDEGSDEELLKELADLSFDELVKREAAFKAAQEAEKAAREAGKPTRKVKVGLFKERDVEEQVEKESAADELIRLTNEEKERSQQRAADISTEKRAQKKEDKRLAAVAAAAAAAEPAAEPAAQEATRVAQAAAQQEAQVAAQVEATRVAQAAAKEEEAARWAALRAQFKQGTHAKTVEGAVGAVVEDAAAEGKWANIVQLRLADASWTQRAKVDTLTECSEAEVAEYEAEAEAEAAADAAALEAAAQQEIMGDQTWAKTKNFSGAMDDMFGDLMGDMNQMKADAEAAGVDINAKVGSMGDEPAAEPEPAA
jgi:hypothetical protein